MKVEDTKVPQQEAIGPADSQSLAPSLPVLQVAGLVGFIRY